MGSRSSVRTLIQVLSNKVRSFYEYQLKGLSNHSESQRSSEIHQYNCQNEQIILLRQRENKILVYRLQHHTIVMDVRSGQIQDTSCGHLISLHACKNILFSKQCIYTLPNKYLKVMDEGNLGSGVQLENIFLALLLLSQLFLSIWT